MFTFLLFGIYFSCLGLLLPYRYMLILRRRFKQSLHIFSSLFGRLPYNLPWPIQIDSISSAQTPWLHLGTCLLHWGLNKFFSPNSNLGQMYGSPHLVPLCHRSLSYNGQCLKMTVSYFFVQIFCCFWWEGKCGPSYISSWSETQFLFFFFTSVIINLLEEEDKLTALKSDGSYSLHSPKKWVFPLNFQYNFR